jgi:hypothetical protein
MFIAATERAATAITDLDFYRCGRAAIKPVAVRTTPPSPGEVFDGRISQRDQRFRSRTRASCRPARLGHP